MPRIWCPSLACAGSIQGSDDAGNLAWKLAAVMRGEAADSLLDSYSIERVHAARENIRYGAKSTEFMAPPNYGFRLMREAALRLALENDSVRSLVNPRQTTAIEYVDSPLNIADFGAFDGGPHAGCQRPRQYSDHRAQRLSELFGQHFVALYFGDIAPATKGSGGVRVYSVCDTVAVRVRWLFATATFTTPWGRCASACGRARTLYDPSGWLRAGRAGAMVAISTSPPSSTRHCSRLREPHDPRRTGHHLHCARRGDRPYRRNTFTTVAGDACAITAGRAARRGVRAGTDHRLNA